MALRQHLCCVLFFVLLTHIALLHAEPEGQFTSQTVSDTLQADTLSHDWNIREKLWLRTRATLTAVIAWPFEKVVQPAFGALLMPLEPPLEYFFDHDVPERAVELFSFGSQKNILIYPFFSISSGTGSTYGLAYRQEAKSSPSRYSFGGSFEQSVDLDRTWSGEASLLLPFDFARLGVVGTQRNDKARTFYLPQGGAPLLYSDSSSYLKGTLDFFFPLGWSLSLEMERGWRQFKTPREVILSSRKEGVDLNRFNETIEDVEKQGLYKDYEEKLYKLSFGHNTLESRFAPTSGTKWQLSALISDPSILSPYLLLSGRIERALLLGKQRYELTREEHRKKQRYLRHFSFDDAMKYLNPDQFQRIYLERKVLTNYLAWHRVIALEDGAIPIMAHPSLGRSSPLRAYDFRQFADRSTLLWSLEYRWPLLMMVDGVFFNEFGYYYPGEERIFEGALRNSWGFGVRVRRPNFYFFRAQFAFNGTDGVALVVTIRPEYWR